VVRTLATLALAAAVVSLQSDSAPAKLIEVPLLVNGSFERGPELPNPDAKGYKELEAGSRELTGWVVTRAQIDWISAYWDHAHGNRSIDLHGSPGVGGIKQTFATTKGQKYRLTFYLAGNPYAETRHIAKSVMVRVAGEEAKFTFDASNRAMKDMGWQLQTMDFVAEGAETTLEFYSPMTECQVAGPALDDVSVVAVR
jgi:choice-of-anchor C domain-containing protein